MFETELITTYKVNRISKKRSIGACSSAAIYKSYDIIKLAYQIQFSLSKFMHTLQCLHIATTVRNRGRCTYPTRPRPDPTRHESRVRSVKRVILSGRVRVCWIFCRAGLTVYIRPDTPMYTSSQENE